MELIDFIKFIKNSKPIKDVLILTPNQYKNLKNIINKKNK
jgi:hypothetical protein